MKNEHDSEFPDALQTQHGKKSTKTATANQQSKPQSRRKTASGSDKPNKHNKQTSRLCKPVGKNSNPAFSSPETITTDEMLVILKQNIDLCSGFESFIALVQNHGEGIFVTKLRHLGNLPGVHSAEFDTCGEALPGYINTNHSIPELPIPYSDNLTLEQAKAAYLKVLERENEALCNNDFPKADECRDEKEKFEDYFHTVITQKGRIRNIQDQTHADYRLVKANLNNFLKKVKAFNPEYAAYIKAHLVFGFIMVWRE